MNRKQRRLVRIIAIVLAVLLAGSAVISAVISMAYAEEAKPTRNQYALTMEYLSNEQALRISQRLVYTNVSDVHLDRVVFYAPANLLRRQSGMLYASDDLSAAYPNGFLPGGMDLRGVLVNGRGADWGFQGENEIYLRVSCDLDPGENCEFSFDYYLLLPESRAFIGVDDTDLRLSNFYFAPASLEDSRGEFILNTPSSFTEYIETPAADFSASIALPDSWMLAATGEETPVEAGQGIVQWNISAPGVHDFALSFSSRYKARTFSTDSGIQLRCLSNAGGADERIFALASEALTACEAWFGPAPFDQLDLVQSGFSGGFQAHSGMVWLNGELLKKKNADELAHAIRYSIAKQYFGMSARARVSSDAWLSDSICEYISYLLLEEADGHEAYLKALNDGIVDSLQLTIPGGLVVSSDAALFDPYEYEIIVLDRGAAVFHELRTAMGPEKIIAGFRVFHEMGLQKEILTEMDLVSAMDSASGGSWESFLTDWVFNIGDYVNQTIEWLD